MFYRVGDTKLLRREALALLMTSGLVIGTAPELLAQRPRRQRRHSGNGAASAMTQQQIEAMIQQHIADYMDKSKAPGVAVAYYWNGVKGVVVQGQAKPDGTPVAHDTVFGIGSSTKIFTATLLACQCLDQPDKFHLNDSAASHLPYLAGKKLGWIKEIKLVDLATHTAFGEEVGPMGEGLYLNQPPSPDLVNWWADYPGTKKPLPPHPGTQYHYSNTGFVTLGYAIVGADYKDLLARKITNKLGMTNTASFAFLPDPSKMSQGSRYADGTAKPVDGHNTDLNSNADDMLLFLEAQLSVLAADTPLGRAIAMTHTVHFQNAGPNMDLGLAWQISKKTPTTYTKDGLSSRGGCGSWIGFIPELQFGIVALSNIYVGPETRKQGGVLVDSLGNGLLKTFAAG